MKDENDSLSSPYAAPQNKTANTNSGLASYNKWAIAGMTIGMFCALGALASAFYVAQLYFTFPDLRDESRKATYWPELAASIHLGIATAYALVSFALFWFSWPPIKKSTATNRSQLVD